MVSDDISLQEGKIYTLLTLKNSTLFHGELSNLHYSSLHIIKYLMKLNTEIKVKFKKNTDSGLHAILVQMNIVLFLNKEAFRHSKTMFEH